MSKKDKKKKGQFDHYKKWTTNEGYTFLAETKEEILVERHNKKKEALKKAHQKQKDFLNHKLGK